MSEMVERVARALFDAAVNNGAFDGGWHDLHEWSRDRFMLEARAAIAAMREPTEAMINQADCCGVDQDPVVYWQAMIDEALR